MAELGAARARAAMFEKEVSATPGRSFTVSSSKRSTSISLIAPVGAVKAAGAFQTTTGGFSTSAPAMPKPPSNSTQQPVAKEPYNGDNTSSGEEIPEYDGYRRINEAERIQLQKKKEQRQAERRRKRAEELKAKRQAEQKQQEEQAKQQEEAPRPPSLRERMASFGGATPVKSLPKAGGFSVQPTPVKTGFSVQPTPSKPSTTSNQSSHGSTSVRHTPAKASSKPAFSTVPTPAKTQSAAAAAASTTSSSSFSVQPTPIKPASSGSFSVQPTPNKPVPSQAPATVAHASFRGRSGAVNAPQPKDRSGNAPPATSTGSNTKTASFSISASPVKAAAAPAPTELGPQAVSAAAPAPLRTAYGTPLRRKAPIKPTTEAAKAAQAKFANNSNKCLVCGKSVYAMEKLEADGMLFHKNCFRCSECNRVLKLGNYASQNNVIWCKNCFKQLFKLKGNYDEGFGGQQHKYKWVNKDEGPKDSET
eukprot:TRINITY_DN10645_c0_g1_i1.p1 TRINITY_DN10645_c0_g1~~TRINITY_DN10645_c0_g1_i1.p1  ORF type:complete len:477 (+),score=104.97 TRINITY_DN10645_c0_g1_i1:253-1683(+)